MSYLYAVRIYVDISHPAYAHALRHFITAMRRRGHEVLVSARDKDITHCLLRGWGIGFISRGRGSTFFIRAGRIGFAPARYLMAFAGGIISLSGKITNLARVLFMLVPRVRRFRPDLVVSFASYQAALTGRLLGRPVITFEDTEDSAMLHLVNSLLSTRMVTTACFEKELGRRHIRFEGYKELAALHPSQFVPEPLPPEIVKPYTVMRFVAWRAFHDRGHTGISDKMKREVVRRLSGYGNVYISSEDPLPDDLEAYRLPVECTLVHSLLAGASLFFGESASMAAEAAVLGVPAIYIDNTGRSYTRELEGEHGLLYNFGEGDAEVQRALKRAGGLLEDPETPGLWQRKRSAMLAGKVDLTAYMVELAEGYS